MSATGKIMAKGEVQQTNLSLGVVQWFGLFLRFILNLLKKTSFCKVLTVKISFSL